MDEIIVGVDESATARAAAFEAATLAQQLGRPLHLVMAMKKSKSQSVQAGSETIVLDPLANAEQFLLSLKGELPGGLQASEAVVAAEVSDALCSEAERLNASIIVVGNKRLHSAARVLGAIALDVAKRAPCNVYIVHTTG
jgi:nucleotide-binding universal stress UspA family protein